MNKATTQRTVCFGLLLLSSRCLLARTSSVGWSMTTGLRLASCTTRARAGVSIS